MIVNRLAMGVVVACSVAMVTPACGSDDGGDSGSGGGAGSSGASGSGSGGASGGSSGGGGGSSGASGGAGGTAAGGGTAGDASVGGAAGGPADGGNNDGGNKDGGPCGPLSGTDSACDKCLNNHCCDEFKNCASDTNCNEIITCLQGGKDMATCIAQAGSEGAAFTALGACLQTNCSSDCT